MSASSARYLCSCGGAALVSHLSTKGCYCSSAATRAVRPRSQSCMPLRILSPTSSATAPVSDSERWISTTGPGAGQSKSPSPKDWMQYLSRFSPNVDISSVSRVLTSLHVDLPRNLPQVRRLFPSISFAQLQQIFLATNRFRRDKVPSSSNQQSCLGSKDTIRVDNTKESSSAELKRAVVHDSTQLHYEEKSVSGKSEETESSAASLQQRAVPDSVTATADKSQILADISNNAPTTDSVMSKFSTVASGIARQVAEYMPTVDVNVATQSKSPTHVQQKQQGRELDGKAETKPSEVKKDTSAAQKQKAVRRQLVARSSIDRQTRGLVQCLRDARTSTSQLVRLEELCQHIAQYPDCTGIAVKVCLLIACISYTAFA